MIYKIVKNSGAKVRKKAVMEKHFQKIIAKLTKNKRSYQDYKK